ncbi:MAG: T9SS type A sorting domain-containing protein [Bacteroidales bacterium]|nr:T9SS type A sorting domain-containing protein [Bacteroidales bacterium]
MKTKKYFFAITISVLLSIIQLTAQTSLIHFWYFDESIPNNTPLTELDATYSLVSEPSKIEYHSALAGYPFDSNHPNWRKASMERRNAPTEINYRPIANNGLPYNADLMRGIQIKQPFTGDGGENTMIFHLPTSGYEEVIFNFAALDEGAAESLIIDYSVQEVPVWITEGMQQSVFTLANNYLLFTVDFSPSGSNIFAADDNPHFKIRIRFDGDNMDADEGNRVTFNNFSLDGKPMPGTNNPPVVTNPVPFQTLIENGNTAQFDLNNVYTDPEGDDLDFEAESSRPDFVQVNLSGNNLVITPLRRGDATVTISATDGFNPAVTQSFRVLVYPEAFDLHGSDFTFAEWNNNQPELTYPENMLFLQSDISDPGLNSELFSPYYIPADDYHEEDQATVGFPYNNTRRTRINGLGAGGISFINTGRDRDLGGALVAINTHEISNMIISFLAGTMLRNERLYAIRLQYRIGTEGNFMNLMHNGQIVEYLASADGHMFTFENIELPQELLNQEYVQLLWRYYHVDGDIGPRPQLRLDDIYIVKSLSTEDLSLPAIKAWASGRNIFIDTNQAASAEIKIFNLMGQKITDQALTGEGIHVIDGYFATGLYLVTVLNQGRQETLKVLVK